MRGPRQPPVVPTGAWAKRTFGAHNFLPPPTITEASHGYLQPQQPPVGHHNKCSDDSLAKSTKHVARNSPEQKVERPVPQRIDRQPRVAWKQGTQCAPHGLTSIKTNEFGSSLRQTAFSSDYQQHQQPMPHYIVISTDPHGSKLIAPPGFRQSSKVTPFSPDCRQSQQFVGTPQTAPPSSYTKVSVLLPEASDNNDRMQSAAG